MLEPLDWNKLKRHLLVYLNELIQLLHNIWIDMSDIEPTTAALWRRRGVTKASITKLTAHLSELETKVNDPMTLGHAQKLLTKLESLDSEFKQQHLTVTDSITEDA